MRNQRHLEAINAIENKDFNCYIQASVGFGKTVMSIRLLKRMLELGVLSKGDKVLYQTSGTPLIASFHEEVELVKELFGYDILEDLEINLQCYQSRTLLKDVNYQYVINDEADYPGEVYTLDLLKYKGKMLYMSGTFGVNNLFNYMGVEMSKKDWIEQVSTLAFDYPLEQGQKDGLLVPFETTIIYHTLTDMKYGKLWKNQAFEFSEKVYWQKCQEAGNKYRFIDVDERHKFYLHEAKSKNPKMIRDRNVTKYLSTMGFEQAYAKGKVETEISANRKMVEFYGLKATNLIHQSKSKLLQVRPIIRALKGRTIVWARHLEYLDELLGAKYVLRESELEDFNSGKINILGTAKKINRGVTPKNVDNLVLMSSIGSATEFEQLIGRVIRLDHRPDKMAHLYVVVTLNTYSENWLRKGCKKGDSYLDLNIKNIIRL